MRSLVSDENTRPGGRTGLGQAGLARAGGEGGNHPDVPSPQVRKKPVQSPPPRPLPLLLALGQAPPSRLAPPTSARPGPSPAWPCPKALLCLGLLPPPGRTPRPLPPLALPRPRPPLHRPAPPRTHGRRLCGCTGGPPPAPPRSRRPRRRRQVGRCVSVSAGLPRSPACTRPTETRASSRLVGTRGRGSEAGAAVTG